MLLDRLSGRLERGCSFPLEEKNKFEGFLSTSFWKGIRDGALAFARQYNATVIDLPQLGLYGNSHFLFLELNNRAIADHLQTWLEARGL